MALIYNGSQVNSLIYNGNETTGVWNGEVVWSPIPPGPPIIEEVTIGTQTWKTVNLAIDDGGSGIAKIDNVTANGVNFGTQYYYSNAAANRIANTITGWRLPTTSDWQTLISYLGSDMNVKGIKSTSGWSNGNGTNALGFNSLPVGYYDGNYGDLRDVGVLSIYRTNTYDTVFKIDFSHIYKSDPTAARYSVRLIKDN